MKIRYLLLTKYSNIVNSKFTTLSLAQVAGLMITTVAGTGIWFIVAAVAKPEDVGILGRVISTGTLIAGLITAGLGQFILTIVHSSTHAQLKKYLWFGVILGSFFAALIAGTIGIIQEGMIDQVAIATGLFSAGIAITNLQDALYLGTGLPYDVPAKGAVIVVTRFVILIGFTFIRINLTVLLLIFLLSQITIAIAWVLIRGPRGIKNHIPRESLYGPRKPVISTLAISYLYSIAITSITTGVPALVTTIVPPVLSGTFYMAWVIASLFGSVSVAVANSILALTLGTRNLLRQLIKIMLGLTSFLCACGLLLTILLPNILSFFDQQYATVPDLFVSLVIGQIFFGITLISLAAYRSLMLNKSLVFIFILWPITEILCVYIGLISGGIKEAIFGYIIGNILVSIPIIVLSIRTVLTVEYAGTTLVDNATNI